MDIIFIFTSKITLVLIPLKTQLIFGKKSGWINPLNIEKTLKKQINHDLIKQ